VSHISLETLSFIKEIVSLMLAYLIIAGLSGAFQAWMAYKAGDDTAAQFGMMTINPFVHVDPVSLWLMPLGYVFLHVIVGMSRPIPIIWHNITAPFRRLKICLVALAEPIAILGIITSMIILHVLTFTTLSLTHAMAYLANEMTVYNYINGAIIGFSTWFLPYRLFASVAQLYVHNQEKKAAEVNYTIVLVFLPLIGAVICRDISFKLLVHFEYAVETALLWILNI